jgi:hypothetical protein
VNLSLTIQVGGPFDVRLFGGRSRLNYQGAVTDNHDDDITKTYGFGLIYRLKETLRFGLNGEWRHRSSERSFDRTYDNDRIYATLTWGK